MNEEVWETQGVWDRVSCWEWETGRALPASDLLCGLGPGSWPLCATFANRGNRDCPDCPPLSSAGPKTS